MPSCVKPIESFISEVVAEYIIRVYAMHLKCADKLGKRGIVDGFPFLLRLSAR